MIRGEQQQFQLGRAEIEKVTYLNLEFVGPEQVSLIAAVDLAGDDPESDVAADFAMIERALEETPNISGAVLTLEAWCADALTAGMLKSDLLEQAKKRFAAEGIKIT